jgi:hypothetical protein
MSLKRILSVVFTALMLMLALAGCGDSNTPVTSDINQSSIDQTEQSLTRPGDPTTDIPCCCNCDYILENCEANGWKPTALCNYCATGNCSTTCEHCQGL